jgi:outer membrane receptor for ferrienterochelin and colicins
MKVVLPGLLILIAITDVNANSSEKNNLYDLSLQQLSQVDVTIATGNATPLDKAPSTASVIYASDIHTMGARTLDDVLALIPGLHVAPSSQSRLDSVYHFRGIHTGFNSQVLLLMNGTAIQNTVQGGRPTLFRLPVASIDRVEVIRGPGSAVYGADAYAGVINVITKDASSITSETLQVKAGSFDGREFSFSGATQWQEVDISLVTSYQQSDGDSDRKISYDQQSALDQALGTQASLAPGSLSTGYKVIDTHLAFNTPRWRLNLWHWATRDAGVGAGGAQALDPTGYDDGDILMADFAYEFQNDPNWQTLIKSSFFKYQQKTKFVLLPAGTVLPIGDDGNLNGVNPVGLVEFTDGLMGNPTGRAGDGQIELVSIYTGFESHRLRVALGARRLSVDALETKNFGPGVLDIDPLPLAVSGAVTDVTGTDDVYLKDNLRKIRYISLQDEWQLLTNLNLTAGVRHDDYSDFGATTNPRLALIWSTTDSLVTKLMRGSAFRAPSFMELYAKNNPVALGTSNLKPEKIDTTELSFNWQALKNLQTILTVFEYTTDDMITFEPVPGGISKSAQNAFEQEAEGFELELNGYINSAWRLQASYSMHNAINQRTDSDVPDTPQSMTKLNIMYRPSADWTVSSQIFYVADRKRRSLDLRDEIADYSLWNLTLEHRNLIPGMNLSFSMHNLLDKEIREPSTGEIPEDYPMESRSFWLGLGFSL